jgi:branched-chain amino acid transport system ATP-binding protein
MPEQVPALELRGISLAYGGLAALTAVDLSVMPGRVTGLIGPNGAGKTSLFDVVSGLARPKTGQVLLHGRDVTRYGPSRRASLGLGRTFQRLELFASLTVAENVAVSAEARTWRRSAARQVVDEQLARLGLTAVAGERADTLPTGTSRLVEIARALANGPSVLLLDEPASGLDAAESERLAELVAELGTAGIAVLLVEHDVELVMRICSDIYVLDRGSVIACGPPEVVRNDAGVRDAYLGQMVIS